MRKESPASYAPLSAHAVEGDVFLESPDGAQLLMTPDAVIRSMEQMWRAASAAMRQRPGAPASEEPSKTLWRGRQWRVTEAGFEAMSPDGRVLIAADRLSDPWRKGALALVLAPVNLLEEGWVDIDDYLTGYLVALALHSHRQPSFDPSSVMTSIRAAVERCGDRYGRAPGAFDVEGKLPKLA